MSKLRRLSHYDDGMALDDDGEYMNADEVMEELERIKSAPPTYSHRNGETDLPTVDGAYYFVGILGWGDNRENHEDWVDVYDGDIYTFGHDKYWSLDDTVGRWWGPIVPPQGAE